jgi:hypothetical protein
VIRRAKDGLPARVSGPWTQEKLSYVQKYATALMRAMVPKRNLGRWSELVYLDFLAGSASRLTIAHGSEFVAVIVTKWLIKSSPVYRSGRWGSLS